VLSIQFVSVYYVNGFVGSVSDFRFEWTFRMDWIHVRVSYLQRRRKLVLWCV